MNWLKDVEQFAGSGGGLETQVWRWQSKQIHEDTSGPLHGHHNWDRGQCSSGCWYPLLESGTTIASGN